MSTDSGTLAVIMDPQAQAVIEEHAFGRIDVEVGGFLIGTLGEGVVHVQSAKPALTAASAQTHLTITHEAWDEVLGVMDTEYPGLQIVGWYHTHPGFGLFLSDYDVFIQENFFAAEGQVALVVDPIIGEFAFFRAADGQAVKVAGGTTQREAVRSTVDDNGAALRARMIDAEQAPGRGARWVPVMAGVVIAGVVVGSGTWFVGVTQGQGSERRASRSQVAELQARVDDLQGEVGALLSEVTRLESASSAQPAESPATGEAEPATSQPDPPPPQPGDEVRVTVPYTVRSGDSWWRIAARFLGQGALYPTIQEANPGIARLRPGDEVSVPQSGSLVEWTPRVAQ